MKAKIQALRWMIKFGIYDLFDSREREDLAGINLLLMEATAIVLHEFHARSGSGRDLTDREREIFQIALEDQKDFWTNLYEKNREAGLEPLGKE